MNSINKNISSLTLLSILAALTIGLSGWKSPQAKKPTNDTTKNKRSAQYSKKTIITFDKNGKPHEEIIENFEGDEGLREFMLHDFNFDFPPVPDVPSIPDIPMVDIPAIPDLPPMPDFDLMIPEVPPVPFAWDSDEFNSFHFDNEDWESIGHLNENLGDMLNDRLDLMGPEFEARMEEMQERLKEMDFSLNENLAKLNGFNFEGLNEHLSQLSDFAADWENRVKDFEEAAQKELVKDGYLKANEKIESMSWSDDEIEFNGKSIKKEHLDKYQDLKEKYLKRKSNLGRIE